MPLTVNSASFFDPNYPGAEQGTTRLVWSKNVVFIDLEAPSDWATNNTYFVELEIGVCDSISLLPSILLNSAIEEPDENGTLIFEIQKFIDDYEGIKVPVPNYNSTQVEIHEVPKFYVKVFENIDGVRTQKLFDRMNGGTEFDGENVVVIPASSWRFDAIQAGLDRENFNYQLQQNWIYDTDKRKFLTSVEDRKSSHKLANEFLYWYGALPNLDSLSVFSKIYYDDNTEEDIILFDATLIGSDIQCIPTRYSLIKEKSTFPLKKIEAWSIYIAYNGNRASEYFRYELPDQPNREAKNFLYRNSLGVFDTLVCAGDFEEYLESESSYASIKDKINYEVSEAQKLLISQTGKRGGTANTAFLNRDQADSKQDFILSKEVLVQDKNQFIPIIIAKNKQIYNIKNTSLIGYSIEYEHAHNVRLYTKDILRPKLGEVVSPPALPKFYIKNTGPSGYVRVEYDSIVVDITPNTEESIEIELATSVKVTWLIVNPDTLSLDADRVNIAYPNYKFPPRFDIATFDSVVQSGSTVVGIPDEIVSSITIKKAREFIFVMPNNDYVAEIKFKNLECFFDFDFENPFCTNSTADGQQVVTIKDRKGLIPNITQNTPALRAVKQVDRLVFTASSYVAIYPNCYPPSSLKSPTVFAVTKQRIARTGTSTFFRGHTTSGGGIYESNAYGVKMPDDFAYLSYKLTTSFIPTYSSYNNQLQLVVVKYSGALCKVRIGSSWIFRGNSDYYNGMNFNQGVDFGSTSVDWDFYRLFSFAPDDKLTADEESIISNKLMSKYAIP